VARSRRKREEKRQARRGSSGSGRIGLGGLGLGLGGLGGFGAAPPDNAPPPAPSASTRQAWPPTSPSAREKARAAAPDAQAVPARVLLALARHRGGRGPALALLIAVLA